MVKFHKIHDDLDRPPDLPAFRNEIGLKKPAQKESLADALSGAMLAFIAIQTVPKALSVQALLCWNFSR
jgi:hypothetical protein